MIQFEEVSFGYEQEEFFQNTNLHISEGECVLLCGESGCGKTTATKMINGLIPHFMESGILNGTVSVDGSPVAETEPYILAKCIGSVFQNPKSQFFRMDTDSELAFGLENEGIPKKLMEAAIDKTVSDLKIQKLLGRNIFSLSGGEKQLLAFASVYAMSPKVYILDEPTANLDEASIERLKEQILYLKQQGHTVVIAEHRLYFLKDMIDRALYFRNGKIMHEFSNGDFNQLDDDIRKQMGLRTLQKIELSLSEADKKTEDGALVVQNICCSYDKRNMVLKNISFRANPGEVLAITGANGSGKTTLMRCLCGLIKEADGSIILDGKKRNRKERKKKSFLVMQDVNHQLFCDSVWNECEQAAGKVLENTDIEEILRKLDLIDYKDKHPMALSGGQKQRLAVATALLSDKKIVIFDEPTSGLDYRHMCEVTSIVRFLAKQGKIVIVVSHDNEFMAEACDRMFRII